MAQAIASRYAHAFADAVLRGQSSDLSPEEALSQLRTFEATVNESVELRNVLLSPAVSSPRKHAVVRRIAAAMTLSKLVTNLLFVIVDRRRTGILGEIAGAFEQVLDERRGIVRSQVLSASPLGDEERAAVEAELARLSGKQVRCDFAIDPALIGGVVARVGSKLYDGSVRTQLEQLRGRLVAQ
jgi:F-type H+-transporting ATPase subunit delta